MTSPEEDADDDRRVLLPLADHVPPEEAEATLVPAILAVEALHGEAQARLDIAHAFDAKLRTVVIDAPPPWAATSTGCFWGS